MVFISVGFGVQEGLSRLLTRWICPGWADHKRSKFHNHVSSLLHASASAVGCHLALFSKPQAIQDSESISPVFQRLLEFTGGYMLFDTVSMTLTGLMALDQSMWLHHGAVLSVIALVLKSRKYAGLALCELTSEINSVFLHIRSLLRKTGSWQSSRVKRRIVWTLLLLTFVVYRFGVHLAILVQLVRVRRKLPFAPIPL